MEITTLLIISLIISYITTTIAVALSVSESKLQLSNTTFLTKVAISFCLIAIIPIVNIFCLFFVLWYILFYKG